MDAARILQLRRSYLVHCFLYYELDEAIISDELYWKMCDELIDLQKRYPELCASLPLHQECAGLGTDYSRPLKPNGEAFVRTDYRYSTITAALRLLHRHKKSRVSFEKFAERHGYQLED